MATRSRPDWSCPFFSDVFLEASGGADVGFYLSANRLHKSKILWCKFQSLYFIQRFISAICSVKRTRHTHLSVLSLKKGCTTGSVEKKKWQIQHLYCKSNQCKTLRFYLNTGLSVELSPAPMRTYQAGEMMLHYNFRQPPQWLFDCSLLGRGVSNLSRWWWWMYVCVFYGMSIPVKCLS